jgi:hypothetical protein
MPQREKRSFVNDNTRYLRHIHNDYWANNSFRHQTQIPSIMQPAACFLMLAKVNKTLDNLVRALLV